MPKFNVTQTYYYENVEAANADEAHEKVNAKPGEWFSDMETEVEAVEPDEEGD